LRKRYRRLVFCRVSLSLMFPFILHLIRLTISSSPELLPPPPTSTHTIHAALTRSTGPSLGTIVLASLLLTAIRLLALLTALLRVLPSYFPLVLRPWLQPLTYGAAMAVGMLDNASTSLSKYALVYSGLTGDAFFPSARRAKALTGSVENSNSGKYKRKFKTERMSNAICFF
jgi:Plasma-membrane choline transporter